MRLHEIAEQATKLKLLPRQCLERGDEAVRSHRLGTGRTSVPPVLDEHRISSKPEWLELGWSKTCPAVSFILDTAVQLAAREPREYTPSGIAVHGVTAR